MKATFKGACEFVGNAVSAVGEYVGKLAKRSAAPAVVTTVAAVGTTAAHAAVDVTAVTAAVTDAGTAAATVAAAVLIMVVSIRAYKYIRSAL